jgi:hypothetical protein
MAWNTPLAARRANSHHHTHRSSLSLTPLRWLTSPSISEEISRVRRDAGRAFRSDLECAG